MPYPVKSRKTRHPGAVAVVAFILMLILIALVTGNTVFMIRTITVEGLQFVSKEEVLEAAGIRPGGSMFAVDTAKIKAGINKNRYLTYVGIWRDLPGHLIIRVKENAPTATLTWMGMLVMLGEGGIVLDESPRIDLTLTVPSITGVTVKELALGKPVVYGETGQTEAVDNILSSLAYLGLSGEISELNLASLDNLYLVTVGGLQVMLGNGENMLEKLALLKTLLPYLQNMADTRGGVLDVSTGVAADFRAPKKAE